MPQFSVFLVVLGGGALSGPHDLSQSLLFGFVAENVVDGFSCERADLCFVEVEVLGYEAVFVG